MHKSPPYADVGARTCRRNCFRNLDKIHDVSTELLAFTLLITLAIPLSGCRSEKTPRAPTIEFTKIPPAAQGGRERVDNVAGRVTGAHPGQLIVVYAGAGRGGFSRGRINRSFPFKRTLPGPRKPIWDSSMPRCWSSRRIARLRQWTWRRRKVAPS